MPKSTRQKLPMLISYFYLREQSEASLRRVITNPNIELLVDSGAFSALNVGAEITLDEYLEFCHKWKDYLFGYMALDKLQDPVQTDKNLKVMIASGLKPIPVHVLGDTARRMDELFELSEWVALGGLRRPQRGPAPVSYIRQKMLWARGRHVHWLGYTRKQMLEAFRPYSADCSSWASGMMYGQLTFYLGHGEWSVFTRPKMIRKWLHDAPAIREALDYYEIPRADLFDERHWHNGNSTAGLKAQECMLTKLPARSWVRYVLDFKQRFGVRLFLACHDSQVDWMLDGHRFITDKPEYAQTEN